MCVSFIQLFFLRIDELFYCDVIISSIIYFDLFVMCLIFFIAYMLRIQFEVTYFTTSRKLLAACNRFFGHLDRPVASRRKREMTRMLEMLIAYGVRTTG
jgi:hypothetical protein